MRTGTGIIMTGTREDQINITTGISLQISGKAEIRIQTEMKINGIMSRVTNAGDNREIMDSIQEGRTETISAVMKEIETNVVCVRWDL
jgi:predicted transcriptional regulator